MASFKENASFFLFDFLHESKTETSSSNTIQSKFDLWQINSIVLITEK